MNSFWMEERLPFVLEIWGRKDALGTKLGTKYIGYQMRKFTTDSFSFSFFFSVK